MPLRRRTGRVQVGEDGFFLFDFFRILSVDEVISAGFAGSWQSDIPQQNVRYLILAGFAEYSFAAMFGS